MSAQEEVSGAMASAPGHAARSGLLVANPAAGGARADLLDEVARRCESALEMRRLPGSGPDSWVAAIADAVREYPVDVVVTVGGDGTVRQVAEGLARGLGHWPGGGGGDRPGVIVAPAGSGNSAFRALWGEVPWTEALEAALAGRARSRSVDLIRIVEADRASLLGVNVGLVAEVAELIERDKAERAGDDVSTAPGAAADDSAAAEQRYWAAFAEVLGCLRSPPLRVTVDGEPVHDGPASMVTIGGVQSFGRGMFKLLPRSRLDDGLLDCCVVGEVSPEELAELASLARDGGHLGHPRVAYAQGRTVSVEHTGGEPLAVEHDGDPRPAGSEITLHAVPAALSVIVR